VEGRRLHTGGESRGCRVYFWGGAKDPKVDQTAFICEEKLQGQEAGLFGQDVGGGTPKAVCCPSLDLVPELGELPCQMDGRYEDVCAIAEDGKQEGGGQSVAEEGRKTDPRGGEPFDRHKGCLGLGQAFDEVGCSGDRGGEPVAQPPSLSLGFEDRPV